MIVAIIIGREKTTKERGGPTMATPIAPTPRLDRKSSIAFLDKVAKNLKKSTKAIPTPHIDNIISSIMNDALRKTKRNS